jgi:uroporphyrinogen-III synthase
MPPQDALKVVLVSAPGTLAGIDAPLRRAGVRLVRIASMNIRAVEPATWLKRVENSATYDRVIVTSRSAVATGVVPWLARRKVKVGAIQFWAVGPGTEAALRAIGIRRVQHPRTIGAKAILAKFRNKSPMNILYFRSDRAGPTLARQLRRLGHRVTDLVVYRLGEAPAFGASARRALRESDLLVVTSPSSLASLRRGLNGSAFARLRRTARLVVLGERSLRAAHVYGFRQASVAPSTTAQGFTRYLLRELRDALT